MAAQYAFVMKGMTKTFPGAPKPVLSNIDLQFYQGAKIGIVGPNGAGKSTLMKIMAGIDTDYTGEAWPGEYITVWDGGPRGEDYVQDEAARGVVYEVNQDGVVSYVRVGGPSIQYVEGCA